MQCRLHDMQLCLHHHRQHLVRMHLPLGWCETLTIIAPRSIGYAGFDEAYDQDWHVYDIAFFEQGRALGFIVS